MKLLIILANIAAFKASSICNDLPSQPEASRNSTSELPTTTTSDLLITTTSELPFSTTSDLLITTTSEQSFSTSSSAASSSTTGQEKRQGHRKSKKRTGHKAANIVDLAFIKDKLLQNSTNQNDKYNFKRNSSKHECLCGISNEIARIENGVSVNPKHKYPWMALIRTNKNNRYFLCGGSIISKYFILTAAHCFIEYESVVSPAKVKVTIGDFSRSSDDDIQGVTKTVEVEKILLNPNFSLYNKHHDIALVRLKLPMDLTSHKEIGQICLPENYTYYNEVVSYAGWGIQDHEFKTSASELQEGSGPSEDPCVTSWDKHNWFSQFCLKGYVQASFLCQGDSGGPIMRVNNGRYEIIGIVSNGISYYGDISLCSVPYGQLNVMKVSYYLNWIYEIMDSNC